MKGQVNLRGKGCSSLIENRTQDTSSEVLSHYAGRLYSLRGQRHSDTALACYRSALTITAAREKRMTVMWWLAMRGMGGSLASGFGRLSGCRGHRFGLVGFHLAAFVVEFGPVFNRLVS